jgi:hypothetical protein
MSGLSKALVDKTVRRILENMTPKEDGSGECHWHVVMRDGKNINGSLTDEIESLIATVAEEVHNIEYEKRLLDTARWGQKVREAAWVTCSVCEGCEDLSEFCETCGTTGQVSRERVAELELAEWLENGRELIEGATSRKFWARSLRNESDRREAERRKAREAT